METKFRIEPSEVVGTTGEDAPASTSSDVGLWVAGAGLGTDWGGFEPLVQPHWCSTSNLLVINEHVVEVGALHLVPLRPGDHHRRRETGEIDIR